MEPRISLVTLGVDDLDRAVAFYEAMGLRRYGKVTEGVAFFQMGGVILALWPREELAADAGLAPEAAKATPRFTGTALAYNTRAVEEVAVLLAQAEAAGGRILKHATRAPWGGTQGYFQDTEGHLWEVAYNPDFPIDAEGRIALPE